MSPKSCPLNFTITKNDDNNNSYNERKMLNKNSNKILQEPTKFYNFNETSEINLSRSIPELIFQHTNNKNNNINNINNTICLNKTINETRNSFANNKNNICTSSNQQFTAIHQQHNYKHRKHKSSLNLLQHNQHQFNFDNQHLYTKCSNCYQSPSSSSLSSLSFEKLIGTEEKQNNKNSNFNGAMKATIVTSLERQQYQQEEYHKKRISTAGAIKAAKVNKNLSLPTLSSSSISTSSISTKVMNSRNKNTAGININYNNDNDDYDNNNNNNSNLIDNDNHQHHHHHHHQHHGVSNKKNQSVNKNYNKKLTDVDVDVDDNNCWILRYSELETDFHPWSYQGEKKFCHFDLVPWRKQYQNKCNAITNDIINLPAWQGRQNKLPLTSKEEKSLKKINKIIENRKNRNQLRRILNEKNKNLKNLTRVRLIFSIELRHKRMDILKRTEFKTSKTKSKISSKSNFSSIAAAATGTDMPLPISYHTKYPYNFEKSLSENGYLNYTNKPKMLNKYKKNKLLQKHLAYLSQRSDYRNIINECLRINGGVIILSDDMVPCGRCSKRTTIGCVRQFNECNTKMHAHSIDSYDSYGNLSTSTERPRGGALALHYAAARGCIDCVRLLTEATTEISANTQMDNDVTPVYLAAQEGHLEVLKFLVLEAGGSLYVRARDGMAPIHAASQMGCLDCLKWMVEEQGVDPNLRDGDGATPLHFAASRGHLSSVRWLLNHGAKLSLDKYGKSPINDAAENQQVECLNILVQHGTAVDYVTQNGGNIRQKTGLKYNNGSSKSSRSNTIKSKSSTGSSDVEPFYLHPPSARKSHDSTSYGTQSRTSSEKIYTGVMPNDGLYVNPMRNGSITPPSPNGSISGESFFLHDPQEVIYNRVKDIFDSDCSSSKDGNSGSKNLNNHSNALTVQAEVHSSSSGAASGSDESLSIRSSTDSPKSNGRLINNNNNNTNNNSNSSNNNNNNNNNNNSIRSNFSLSINGSCKKSKKDVSTINGNNDNHDYEDIYLVREESRLNGANKTNIRIIGGNMNKDKYNSPGRSRSKDSGSHSRSASASSTRSNDVIVQYGSHNLNNRGSLCKRNKSNSISNLNSTKYDSPRKDTYTVKNVNIKNQLNTNNNSGIKSDTYESVCPPEDIVERTKQANKNNSIIHNNLNCKNNTNSRPLKRVVSAPHTQTTPKAHGPPPPPLPPPLKTTSQRGMFSNDFNNKNNNLNGNDCVSTSIDNNLLSDSPDSDSGLEVVEEPTLRPSELVKGKHNRTMSTISANKKAKLLNGSSVGNNQQKQKQQQQQQRYKQTINNNNNNTTVSNNNSVSELYSTHHLNQQQLQQQQQQQQQQHQQNNNNNINNNINSSSSGNNSGSDGDYQQSNYSHISYDRPSSRPGGPNLVNKQLVLPFVPPSFPNKSPDGVTHLIKPSEYLKSISDKRSCPSSARSTDTEDYMQISIHHHHNLHQNLSGGPEIPKPPPPPPLPIPPIHGNDNSNRGIPPPPPPIQDTVTRKHHQPLSAISIQDLNSVQLRRTDTKMLSKTFSAPTRSISMQCLSSTNDAFLKTDLIAELKMSKDISGIKKLKVEKAKQAEKEHYTELSKQFTASKFVDQIPDKDQAGNIIPDWKRQMLAKKAAERAKKEFEERMAIEAENRRLSQIPQWKRDLLARREEAENKLKATIYTPRVEETSRITDTWRLKNTQRAVSIDNINFSCLTTNSSAQIIYGSTENDKEDEMNNNNNNNNYNCNYNSNNINNQLLSSDDCNDYNDNSNNHNNNIHNNNNTNNNNYNINNNNINNGNNNNCSNRAENDENENIIPWRAQLRKTNSRLSLIG